MTIEAQALARAILENASDFRWTVQGMGFMRLHLAGHCRLHVWDSRLRVPGVSMIHDHLQWALNSTILSGELVNRIYREENEAGEGDAYEWATIKPGAGCYFKSEPSRTFLAAVRFPERLLPGDTYRQKPDVIHQTEAVDGTVTIIRKEPTLDDSARVFWPAGTTWGSAEPRPATADEVRLVSERALHRWTWV